MTSFAPAAMEALVERCGLAVAEHRPPTTSHSATAPDAAMASAHTLERRLAARRAGVSANPPRP